MVSSFKKSRELAISRGNLIDAKGSWEGDCSATRPPGAPLAGVGVPKSRRLIKAAGDDLAGS